MAQTVIFLILILFVFSWDETRRTLYSIAYRLRRKPIQELVFKPTDATISLILMFFVIPVSILASFDLDNLQSSLISASIVLLVSSIVIMIVSVLYRYSRDSMVSGLIETAAFTAIGSLFPAFRYGYPSAPYESRLLARYAFILAIPPALAFALQKNLNDVNLDFNQLTWVLVGALFIQISIYFLEKLLRARSLNMVSYSRILVGIVLLAIIFVK